MLETTSGPYVQSARSISDWALRHEDAECAQAGLIALVDRVSADDPAWISVASQEDIRRQLHVAAKRRAAGAEMPLFGVPYAVKDNIDVLGFDTTAACPAFRYHPSENATVVGLLAEAGAIVIGKTNLDQFATGLVGTRSPFGAVPNSFNPRYVSGGSSSGSASVVARGLVAFALGTDTAGSGRIPAGANNLVGLKPTRGAWSSAGMLPACRSLDCITVLATSVTDAMTVDRIVRGYDSLDPYSRAPTDAVRSISKRPRLGIPVNPQFYWDVEAEAGWRAALEKVDADLIPIDFTSLHSVAALLYEGPWVAERMAAIEPFFSKYEKEMDPVVRQIIGEATKFSASDVFRGMQRLSELRLEAKALMASVDAMLVPTVPAHPTIEQLMDDPIIHNSRLGTYTNFVNLLDWSAIALPAGFRADGLPFGITLIGEAWAELQLAQIAKSWEADFNLPRGALD